MRQIVVIVALLALLACCKSETYKNAVSSTSFNSDADVPRISLADAKKDFDTGAVVIVDSRAEAAYKQEHIAGSINVPLGSPDTEFSKIPQGKKIIVYCS